MGSAIDNTNCDLREELLVWPSRDTSSSISRRSFRSVADMFSNTCACAWILRCKQCASLVAASHCLLSRLWLPHCVHSYLRLCENENSFALNTSLEVYIRSAPQGRCVGGRAGGTSAPESDPQQLNISEISRRCKTRTRSKMQ